MSRRSYCGKNNPNFGKKHSKETREKIRQARLGTKASADTKEKLSQAHKGRKKSRIWKLNISKALTNNPKVILHLIGSKNPNYKHGSFVNERIYRKLIDTSICSNCKTKDGVIDVHHKNGNHKDNNPDNLISLCHKCHGKFHGRPITNNKNSDTYN